MRADDAPPGTAATTAIEASRRWFLRSAAWAWARIALNHLLARDGFAPRRRRRRDPLAPQGPALRAQGEAA